MVLALHGKKPPSLRLCSGLLCLPSENYLQFKGNAPPPRLASVLAFILEVLQRTQSTELCDIDLVLPAVLKCLVLVNELQGELFVCFKYISPHLQDFCTAEHFSYQYLRLSDEVNKIIWPAKLDEAVFFINWSGTSVSQAEKSCLI